MHSGMLQRITAAVGGSIIMHEASHTNNKLAATSDFYEPNLTLFHGF